MIRLFLGKLGVFLIKKSGIYPVNTIEGWEKFKFKSIPSSIGEANHILFTAYESGRHSLAMEFLNR